MAKNTDKVVEDFVEWIWAFNEREREDCYTCKEKVESLEQIGRCTYARPCGHRLWQGKVPDAWRT
jgi:hypothetical protein